MKRFTNFLKKYKQYIMSDLAMYVAYAVVLILLIVFFG